jgi:hypothetical protein
MGENSPNLVTLESAYPSAYPVEQTGRQPDCSLDRQKKWQKRQTEIVQPKLRSRRQTQFGTLANSI